MTVLSKAALIKEYLGGVDTETGIPSVIVEIAVVNKEFDKFNQAAAWLKNYYIPRWDESLSGTLPTVFEVEEVTDKATYSVKKTLIEVVGNTASPYTLP